MKRKMNGKCSSTGRRLRNANGFGTLITKPSGLYLARWPVGRTKVGEKTVTRTNGEVEIVPVYKYDYKCESTHTTNYDEACEFLRKRTAELALHHEEACIDALLEKKKSIEFQLMTLENTKKAEAAARVEAEPAMKLSEAFLYYVESAKRPDSGERTLRGYEGQYGKFADWVASSHPEITEVRQITSEIAENFAAYLRNTKSNNTHNKYIVFLRSMWRTLRWNKYAKLEQDPWEGIRNRELTDEVIKQDFTVEEIARVAQLMTPDFKLLLAIGLYSALRLSDCAKLSWGELDLVRNRIDVMPSKTRRKYKRRSIIPLHPVLRTILMQIPPDYRVGAVIPSIADMYEREPSLVTNRFQRYLRDAGIETIKKSTDGTRNRAIKGFHSLRHTVESLMINAPTPPPQSVVSRLLTHANQSMDERYYHENTEVLTRAISILPSIPALLPAPETAPMLPVNKTT